MTTPPNTVHVSVIEDQPVDDLDRLLLDASGTLRQAFSAATYRALDPVKFKLWCHKRARYGLPTAELIEFLRLRIAGRRAITLGAGNDDLGHLLGIPETDSYIQQTHGVRLHYIAMGQVPTNPPPRVLRLDALEAVDLLRPQVAVASWLTRKFEPGKDAADRAQASAFGVREEEILDRVETYIHIGNEHVHGQKTLLTRAHEMFQAPWLVSRHQDQSANVIYIWTRAP